MAANDLLYTQELTTSVTKSSTNSTSLNMNLLNMQRELSQVGDISEDALMRFVIPAGATQTLCMGTVQAGKILVFRTDREIKLTITTPYGVSVIKQRRDATSVIHFEFISIVAENLEGTEAKGYYYTAGD